LEFNIENKTNAIPEENLTTVLGIGSDEQSVVELDSTVNFSGNCPIYDIK